MDQFLKFIENRDFVRWVLNPDELSEKYWNSFFAENPGEAGAARFARIVIVNLRSRKEPINETTANRLFAEISCSINRKRQPPGLVIRSLLKYAAVAVLFFGIGVVTYYWVTRNSWEHSIPRFTELNNMNKAHLMLSGGKYVPLEEQESVIDYHSSGSIIINNQDTILPERKSKVPEMNQLVIPYGKNSSLTLEDGTTVHLNSGSRLIYPDFFSGNTREVILFGEAYFDVAPLPGKTFVVKTNDVCVEALGTSFNVSAYPSDNTVETVLVKGIVKVTENQNKIFRQDFVLHPSEMACFNRETGKTSVMAVDITNYVSWHQGYLNFESTDLSRIVKRIERYYDVDVRLDNPMLGQLKISGKLKLKEDKDNVIRVVASTASLTMVRIDERYYVLK